ncbi:hypothetical protein BH23ACT9_BH23ACT9_33120 [soil metagenome]
MVDRGPFGFSLVMDEVCRSLFEVTLTAGHHTVEVRVGGVAQRQWPVVAAGVTTRAVGSDPVAVGRAASGTTTSGRPVLLINPDTPDLALAAGPLGVGTGSIVLPSGQAALTDGTATALREIAPDGGRVLLLGGLDAIGPEVADALRAEGHEVQRIGSGSPQEVAAAAAAHAAVIPLYRRDREPQLRPVLVAPLRPRAAALQAAADASSRGASLLLVEEDQLTGATARVIGERPTVWLADALSATAGDAVRRTASSDAAVGPLPDAAVPPDGVWLVAEDDPVAVLATRAAAFNTHVVVGAAAGQQFVAGQRPSRVTVAGDVADPATVAAWWIDGPDAPTASAAITASGPEVVITVGEEPAAHAVHVTVHGREWPGSTTVTDRVITWRPGPRPQLPAALEPSAPRDAPVTVTAVVASSAHQRHLQVEGSVTIAPLRTTSTEGFAVAGGSSEVVGTGPLRTFTIEIEPATGLDLTAVTEEATAILLDAQRGWTARGQRSMQRIGDPAAANIRVVLARPSTVDAFCGRVGLNTGGRLSCWDGRRAMLNLERWTTGVAPFHSDLTVYRRYLVSHEVGHGLGFGHVGCPGAGQPAPVMMQQSKGVSPCVANGWPYPGG